MTSLTGPKTERRSAGFTLLELVLVMVVICTVLAMAAPSLQGFFASRQTEDAAAQIVVLTQFARTQAVSEGRVYRVNFDIEAGTYWLTTQEGGAFRELDSEFGRIFSLPEGTIARWLVQPGQTPRSCVTFHPDGRTEAATVRLTGRKGDVFDITCLSPAERFHVVEFAEETDE